MTLETNKKNKNTVKEKFNGLEVRGFLVTGCKSCPFARDRSGGYGNMETLAHYCNLYNKEFENPDWDSRYMSGCKNSVPEGFPKFCRLKPVTDQTAYITQKYKRIVDELGIIKRIIEE